MVTTVIVFGKDRPWQLRQLLRSMRLKEEGGEESTFDMIATGAVDVVIIACITREYEDGYACVIDEFCTKRYSGGVQVRLVREEEGTSRFAPLLEAAVGVSSAAKDRGSIVMFLTDDCILLEPLSSLISSAAACLSRPRVLAFLSRLHPGLTWCQTRGKACVPPRDGMYYLPTIFRKRRGTRADSGGIISGVGALAWDYTRFGELDWAYPFDLSGGTYRRETVTALLQIIREDKGDGGYRHPNLFEMEGNEAMTEYRSRSRFVECCGEKKFTGNTLNNQIVLAAPAQPYLIVLAINRVQDICRAPLAPGDGPCQVYGEDSLAKNAPSSERAEEQYEPLQLLKYLCQGKNLDLARYRSTLFNSSHVGSVYLLDAEYAATKPPVAQTRIPPGMLKSPALSVLIPVHVGPSDAAKHAMVSVIEQIIEEYDQREESTRLDQWHCPLLSPLQIVLVDDRCQDGSIDAMVCAAKCLVKAHNGVLLSVHDHRMSGETDSHMVSESCSDKIPIDLPNAHIDIVKSPLPGVASALNFGLGHCKGVLVARMDADDVCAPGRLQSEAMMLLTRPELNVLGTCSIVFKKELHTEASKRKDDWEIFAPTVLPYFDLATKINGDGMAMSMEDVRVIRASLPPSDPGFLSWAMLFTCSLSHPTVMFRRRAVLNVGGYNESLTKAEDYDLWLRLLVRDQGCVLSLPRIGLWHRKHVKSTSHGEANAGRQQEEGDAIRRRYMEAIFRTTAGVNDPLAINFDDSEEGAPLSAVSALCNPDGALEARVLDKAARLLVRLEATFLCKHSGRKLTQREKGLIRMDCDARLGELATVLIQKFGRKATAGPQGAWQMWCSRRPDLHIERISLLCRA